jgi:hypothetical protein
MNIKTFDYILDSVKDDLQGYSNFINLLLFFGTYWYCGKDSKKLH